MVGINVAYMLKVGGDLDKLRVIYNYKVAYMSPPFGYRGELTFLLESTVNVAISFLFNKNILYYYNAGIAFFKTPYKQRSKSPLMVFVLIGYPSNNVRIHWVTSRSN